VGKKEFYLVSLIRDLIKKKIKITNFNIKNFVHLGIPSQYEDFLRWKNIFKINEKNKISIKKNSCIMLMGGKGKRLSNFTKPKPFLEYEKKPIYEYIFSKFISQKKIIITNKNYINKINNKKYEILPIEKTKSMFDTVFASRTLLQKTSNYFLTSCDCFGNFDLINFKRIILKDKPNLILFAFEYSNLQKSLGNSHTQLKIKNKKLYNIDVKKDYKNKNYGHAGFFWIKDGSVFEHLYSFKKSKYFKSLKREVLIDDYFKYLIQNNLAKVSYSLLNSYIHIGSEPEYLEYKYWRNYFKKINE
jgi:NDP-sugar pyrophosphorylase family protein